MRRFRLKPIAMDAILPSPKGLPSVSNSAGVYARRVTSPVKAPTAGAAPIVTGSTAPRPESVLSLRTELPLMRPSEGSWMPSDEGIVTVIGVMASTCAEAMSVSWPAERSHCTSLKKREEERVAEALGAPRKRGRSSTNDTPGVRGRLKVKLSVMSTGKSGERSESSREALVMTPTRCTVLSTVPGSASTGPAVALVARVKACSLAPEHPAQLPHPSKVPSERRRKPGCTSGPRPQEEGAMPRGGSVRALAASTETESE
mmetsp:Transcript_56261/g.131779  ORF Transcript_56261/g.131779 Transcript_56261/m.131779 type:complete len:259 (-) Transcript_56261:461-1237(-)